ncbi:DMT family transporter [Pseudomonadota bacterium]
MTSTIRSPLYSDYLLLFSLGAIWGSAFLCIEMALQDFPPTTMAAARIVLGGLVLALIVLFRGHRLPRAKRDWVLLIIIGLFNSAIPFFLIAWGQQFVSGGSSAILIAAGPFVALIISHFTTNDDRLTFAKVLGLSLGFIGVAVLVGVDVLSGQTDTLLAKLAIIAASSCYAFAATLTRKVAHITPLVGSAAVLCSTACFALPLALWIDQPWKLTPSPIPIIALLFLCLVPTSLAYLLRFQLILKTGATFMSQVSYLVPLFAVLWAWLFIGEVPGRNAWLALVLILIGIYISRSKLKTTLISKDSIVNWKRK